MIKACAENESELNRDCNNDMKECLIWLLPEVGFQIDSPNYDGVRELEIENRFQASDSSNLSSIQFGS